ncbi:bifunctional hydroxymethylpyrimidine kinase/phosphomethylpyrimidine kinase [Patulibacter defluvii]|uniref:bifunctional hydroxymethylpyrimidine kinase/phosphomethylpyrimidine kinase n=1 Tax=Patulibacter defluvii TaxID=3095358 RepID=UPI002A74EE9A|nr:bifunctional hydroxymethylpyrimidine kinase/phosphomethylpyrimidine kinase [Patulibacter sp. DM4]
MSVRTPVCLTIATSDSGGGAGIQADLKAFAASGVHGTSAIVGLTAQNTVAVTRIVQIDRQTIVEQVRAVVEDLGVDAVKIGMVGATPTIEAVAEALELVPADVPVVLDPVMVAESGARLLEVDAHRALVERLLPRTTVATPNLPEARALVEGPQAREAGGPDDDAEQLATAIAALGPANVLITGGHRDRAEDLLRQADGSITLLRGERHPDGAAHGSGCTHSSTLAAQLALGHDLVTAARAARAIAGEAVRRGLRDVGAGAGPVDVLGLPELRRRSAERVAAVTATVAERVGAP